MHICTKEAAILISDWSLFVEDTIEIYSSYNEKMATVSSYYEFKKFMDDLLTDATDEELLEMLATADHYWLNQYQQWYDKSKEKSSRLDRFIGECERRYFGYDEDGYTDKTIDRIFNSIFEILDSPQIKRFKDKKRINK